MLQLTDAKGKTLTEVTGGRRGSRDLDYLFTAPADREYRIAVTDLDVEGG